MMNQKILGMALIVGLAVSGCGGNGGGGSMGGDPGGNEGGSVNAANPFDSDLTGSVQLLVSNAGTREEWSVLFNQELVGSGPKFGSVAQNLGVGSFSEVNAVETTFEHDRSANTGEFSMEIRRADGSNVSFDTRNDAVYDSNFGTNPRTNRPRGTGTMIQGTGSSITATSVAIEWEGDDTVTDYLAVGYWLHVADAGAVPRVEIGSFIDGPDFDSSVTVPQLGQATYEGEARGLYVRSFGTGALPDSLEQGQYTGDASLTADFEAGTIRGGVDNIAFHTRVGIDATSASVLDDGLTSFRMTFDPAPITSGGTFLGSGVGLTHESETFTGVSGSWGGRFSETSDSGNNPRAVAGTHAVEAISAGGEAIFTGAFYGVTDDFQ